MASNPVFSKILKKTRPKENVSEIFDVALELSYLNRTQGQSKMFKNGSEDLSTLAEYVNTFFEYEKRAKSTPKTNGLPLNRAQRRKMKNKNSY